MDHAMCPTVQASWGLALVRRTTVMTQRNSAHRYVLAADHIKSVPVKHEMGEVADDVQACNLGWTLA